MEDKYIAVRWPDVQELMEENWFQDECILINDEIGYAKYGDSAYFVPLEKYEQFNKIEHEKTRT